MRTRCLDQYYSFGRLISDKFATFPVYFKSERNGVTNVIGFEFVQAIYRRLSSLK